MHYASNDILEIVLKKSGHQNHNKKPNKKQQSFVRLRVSSKERAIGTVLFVLAAVGSVLASPRGARQDATDLIQSRLLAEHASWNLRANVIVFMAIHAQGGRKMTRIKMTNLSVIGNLTRPNS